MLMCATARLQLHRSSAGGYDWWCLVCHSLSITEVQGQLAAWLTQAWSAVAGMQEGK